jgi:hypothetical protein
MMAVKLKLVFEFYDLSNISWQVLVALVLLIHLIHAVCPCGVASSLELEREQPLSPSQYLVANAVPT